MQSTLAPSIPCPLAELLLMTSHRYPFVPSHAGKRNGAWLANVLATSVHLSPFPNVAHASTAHERQETPIGLSSQDTQNTLHQRTAKFCWEYDLSAYGSLCEHRIASIAGCSLWAPTLYDLLDDLPCVIGTFGPASQVRHVKNSRSCISFLLCSLIQHLREYQTRLALVSDGFLIRTHTYGWLGSRPPLFLRNSSENTEQLV
jgi:hypothetical protein